VDLDRVQTKKKKQLFSTSKGMIDTTPANMKIAQTAVPMGVNKKRRLPIATMATTLLTRYKVAVVRIDPKRDRGGESRIWQVSN
jgi:hypothetical protein